MPLLRASISWYASRFNLGLFSFLTYVNNVTQNVCSAKSVLFVDDTTLKIFRRSSATGFTTLTMSMAND